MAVKSRENITPLRSGEGNAGQMKPSKMLAKLISQRKRDGLGWERSFRV